MDGGRSKTYGTFAKTQQSSTGHLWYHLNKHHCDGIEKSSAETVLSLCILSSYAFLVLQQFLEYRGV